MDKRFISAIRDFTEEQWVEPSRNWPVYWFNRNSYSRWASYEIVELLKNRGDEKASIIIEKFKDTLDDYSCLNPISRNIFQIATSAANDLLDVVRIMEG